jgi:hypothetical protein
MHASEEVPPNVHIQYTPHTRARILYRGLSIGGGREGIPQTALGGGEGGFRGGEEWGGGEGWNAEAPPAWKIRGTTRPFFLQSSVDRRAG